MAFLKQYQGSSLDIEITYILVGKKDEEKLPCTPEDAKFISFPTVLVSHRKGSHEGILLELHMEERLEAPCTEILNIFTTSRSLGIQN